MAANSVLLDVTTTRSKFVIDISEAIIRNAVAGDESSFEAIYHAFRSPVLGLARRICRDDAAANDAAQDIFLQVFRQIHTFRGDGPFWAWLRMIAVRIALDQAAVAARYDQLTPVEAQFSEVKAIENQIAVQQILSELPEQSRLILWLNRIEGFSHQELSGLTGMTESYSKSLVSRALQHLARRHAGNSRNKNRGAA